MTSTLRLIAAGLAAGMVAVTHAGPLEDTVSQLQHRWEEARYATPAGEQEQRLAAVAAEADRALARYPDRAEVLIWHGIIAASYAGAKGGLGALGLAKDAKRDFEKALNLDARALSGSAYTSLGSLYYQVPGWPIGFGSDKKAEEYLRQGLALNPSGIDPNYFYGDFLYRNGKPAEAEQYLRKALQAPAREGRKLADEGRRREIQALLDKIAAERKSS